MSKPMEFAFGENPVRVVLLDGEPWWLAADIAVALEYRDASNMTRNLDEDEKGTQIVSTLGGDQEVLVINESGLYSAILRSRKASAKRFKKWVTAEVLPSIRKHGSYVMPPAADEQEPTPMAAHIEADQVVSAGRVFRSLFTTGRSMGMPRRLAATRANSAAERATGVDLAAELGASSWLEGPDMPEPQRKQYELQQRIRTHLAANSWPSGFSGQQLIEALGLINDKPTQMAVGRCLGLLGYQRQRLPAATPNGIRPWGYRLNTLPVV
ncbi:Bro-N domain-containing protein [Pseudomonas sp. MYb185]|uniref:BRO-N domain-containing protein n=1 Tax=Pseudomonas sp. MYb185 TaxID=1848729 RepID=UPI000CFB8C15|nr:Bro-N domain-containing protein [Pseudomonas sp. MYb185]PRB80544.1 BRO domain protein [Pseudomonas sp. MYb185]